MAVIAIPSILRDKLGDEGVEAFTEVIKEIDLEARKESITIVEERFERRLAEETGKLKTDLMTEIGKNRVDLMAEIGKNRIEIGKNRVDLMAEIANNRVEIEKIRVEVAASKADTLRWMFIFWIGQIGVLSGIIFAMLKLYFK